MAAQELRPMGVGDILDVAFRLYRQRFFTFLLIALIVYVPYSLLMAVFPTAMTQQQTVVIQPEGKGPQPLEIQTFNPAVFIASMVGVFIFAVVLLPLCGAALVHNISASYLGEELTAGQSYARAAPRLLGLIGTNILTGLAMWVGFILCVVPGVIFALWFMLIVPVVMLEGRYGPNAMGRSRELMRGNLGKGFMLSLLVLILTIIISWVIGAVTRMVPWPHPAIGVFCNTILLALILPIQTAPSILLYYDLRIRKEAFDLQMLSQALGQPAPAMASDGSTGSNPFKST
jgi:hypothetical protein